MRVLCLRPHSQVTLKNLFIWASLGPFWLYGMCCALLVAAGQAEPAAGPPRQAAAVVTDGEEIAMTDQTFGEPGHRASPDDEKRQPASNLRAWAALWPIRSPAIPTRSKSGRGSAPSTIAIDRGSAPGLIVLTTTDGHDVEYVGRGLYRLHEQPEVSLSSSDPQAP